MPFYEKGSVRIYYEEAGSGFPLLLIAGGGLNSTISGLKRGDPFDPIAEFKGEYRWFTELGFRIANNDLLNELKKALSEYQQHMKEFQQWVQQHCGRCLWLLGVININ